MNLHTCLFNDSPAIYTRYARVLQRSALKRSPNTPLVIHTSSIDADLDVFSMCNGRSDTYINNTRKTKHLTRLIETASDGEVLCLIDCDMLILDDVSAISMYGDAWDIAITSGTANKYALNTGVVFVRISELTRDLARAWFRTALRMLADPKEHARFKDRCGGINQSSLMSVLTSEQFFSTRILWLETKLWNALIADHVHALEISRIVHIIGKLRWCILQAECKVPAEYRQLVNLWKGYDYADD